MSRRMVAVVCCAVLFAWVGGAAQVDAQRGRRWVVRAQAGEVTVNIPVNPPPRPGSTRSGTPTRLPETDWACSADAHPGGDLAVTCLTRDMHTVTLYAERCQPTRLSLGAGRPGAPTYYLRVACEGR